MAINKTLNNFNEWKEVTKGLYRYVISSNVAYEIHIISHYHDTDILTTNASLYLAGDWYTPNGSCFMRELLLDGTDIDELATVADCVKAAERDYKENMSDV